MNDPRVIVSIVNYNGVDETLRCLASLNRVTQVPFAVMVVDNNSSGGDLELLLAKENAFSFPLAVIGSSVNGGFGAGHNIALREAFKRYHALEAALLLNPDTIVDPFFLGHLLTGLQFHPMTAMVGAMMYHLGDRAERTDKIFFAGGVMEAAGMRAIHNGLGEQDVRQYGDQPYETEFVTGACLLARKEAIQHIGLLEDDYFLYYEDVDWCQRARTEGWKCIIAPQARVWHKVSTSTIEGSDSYIYYHVRNGFVAGVRWGCSFCVRMRSVALYGKQLIKMLFPGKRRWARITMKALRDGWRGRMGRYEA